MESDISWSHSVSVNLISQMQIWYLNKKKNQTTQREICCLLDNQQKNVGLVLSLSWQGGSWQMILLRDLWHVI